ncbi:unnamed protein product, partial [Hapterophycus canaliculatus]
DTLEAAQRTTGAQEGQDRPSTAIAQWKALIAQRDALVTSNGGGDSETPEFATIEAQEATLSERICNLTPATQQDAAAMLEWLLIDSARLQVFHPDYETALRNVIAYLASGSTH